MKYRHEFSVAAPLDQVTVFHRRSESMAAITPPPLRVQFIAAPETLMEGAEVSFNLMLGPLPIHWAARLENVTPSGFDDRLLRGPFAHWRHRHRFEALAPGRTKVIDEITFTLRLHPLWLPVGLVMTASLPLLFRYRAAQTSRLLQAELLEPANPA